MIVHCYLLYKMRQLETLVWVLLCTSSCIQFSGTVTLPGIKQNSLCRHTQESSYKTSLPKPDDDAPYEVNINQTKYILGNILTVTLSGTESFRGFILQVRGYNARSTQGVFIQPNTRDIPARDLNMGTCGLANDTISTWFTSPRKTASISWKAPDIDVGALQVIATVFKDDSTFWTNITSHSFRKGFTPIDLSGCGVSKGCYRYTPGKYPCQQDDCLYLVSWTKRQQSVTFEISAKAEWAAIGFSSDKDMGADDLVMCMKSYNGPRIVHYYNEFPHQTPHEKDSKSFTGQEAEVSEDNYIHCRVTRPLKLPGDDQYSVDLNNDWFQLHAWGSMSEGGSPLKHSLDSPPTSEFKLTLGERYNVIAGVTSVHMTSATSSASLLSYYLFIHLSCH